MTEKNIFIYELFLSLNISDFSLSFMKRLQPRETGHPLFSSDVLLKLRSYQSPVLENLVGGSTFSQQKGGGSHHVYLI